MKFGVGKSVSESLFSEKSLLSEMKASNCWKHFFIAKLENFFVAELENTAINTKWREKKTSNWKRHSFCTQMPCWENYVSIYFQIEWDMIEVTVFLRILNQMEFNLVQNRKENCHHDHIPFNLKGNANIVFSVYALHKICVTSLPLRA